MVRSARLVVDTGIHSLGWSKEKAVDYMVENTAMTKEKAESEIRRWIFLELSNWYKNDDKC